MENPFAQSEHAVRLEWALPGARLLGPAATVTVVVDVLSFTTTLTVALDRGAVVFPYAWADDSAREYAVARDAVLAAGRRTAGPGQVSLSPGSIRAAASFDRLVLPSPNGSTICAALADTGTRVLAASLRNRSAVAAALVPVLAGGGTVALVPAGERWPDGSLRPAVEDLWGAGAVVAALGPADLSPEAAAAAAAYGLVAGDVPAHLAACASGMELRSGGFADDVAIAAELDASTAV
ncbi:MAG: hypothetical protein JWO46_2937, partial [Nocardioidaceae bacterium]|nr:hypothetical protein [Nocardioidaceae bacterium]